MPYLTIEDLYTHLHPEVIDEITRSDDTIVAKAIDAAICEASMYLSRYDLVQLFGNADTPPAIADEYLKSIVKTIACRHLALLCSTGTHHHAIHAAYTDALAALKTIMNGQAKPAGWPYNSGVVQDTPDSNAISWYSNRRRRNYY
jgi:hypothetical protein